MVACFCKVCVTEKKSKKLIKYDNFTLSSIFRPKAFIKKKHALQYQLHSLCSTILHLFLLMCIDVSIEKNIWGHIDVNRNKYKIVEQRLCS